MRGSYFSEVACPVASPACAVAFFQEDGGPACSAHFGGSEGTLDSLLMEWQQASLLHLKEGSQSMHAHTCLRPLTHVGPCLRAYVRAHMCRRVCSFLCTLTCMRSHTVLAHTCIRFSRACTCTRAHTRGSAAWVRSWHCTHNVLTCVHTCSHTGQRGVCQAPRHCTRNVLTWVHTHTQRSHTGQRGVVSRLKQLLQSFILRVSWKLFFPPPPHT